MLTQLTDAREMAVYPDYPLDQPVFTDSILLQVGPRATRADRCSGKMAAAAGSSSHLSWHLDNADSSDGGRRRD